MSVDGSGHFQRPCLVVDGDDRLERNGWLGIHGGDVDRCCLAVVVGGERAIENVAAHGEVFAVGSTQRGIARERETFQILVHHVAILVVGNDLWLIGRIDREFERGIGKLDRSHLIVGRGDRFEQPATCHGAWSALGGLVDDGTVHEHFSRATSVVVHHIRNVGVETLQNLAHHLGGAA